MARPAWVWTPDFRAQVQASIRKDRPLREVAAQHGLTLNAVENAVARKIILRDPVYRKRGEEIVIELIPRACSGCGKRFNATTKFIRLCDPCRERGSIIGDWSLSSI